MIPISNSCFSHHNIFVKENGDVYSFGYNYYGQCGTGNKENVLKPTKIMNNPKIRSIVLGEYNSFYIERNGDMYGCGNIENFFFENERQILEFRFICSNVKKIEASNKILIIQFNNGKVIYREEGEDDNEEINDIGKIVDFSCGRDHCLFLNDQGEVWVKGSNQYMQCGFSNESYTKFITPILLLEDKNIISVVCGWNSSIILTKNEKGNTILKGFGECDFGQLGVAKENTELIKIIDTFPNIASVHCSSIHTIILTDKGEVYGTGYNYYGQLGLGKFELDNHYCFDKINLGNVTFVTACDNHSIFVTKNKEIFICGKGDYGQLGLKRDELGNANLPEILDFQNLKLFNNQQLFSDWSINNHIYFEKDFQERVFSFLLCLKNSTTLSSNKIKLPKPIQHIIIKFSSS